MLQVLLRDFGANSDHVLELSGLAEQFDLTQADSEWQSLQEADQQMAQAKAKMADLATVGCLSECTGNLEVKARKNFDECDFHMLP